MVQQILAYLVLLVAVGFLVKKFLLPKIFFVPSGKKKSDKDCGSGSCGCH